MKASTNDTKTVSKGATDAKEQGHTVESPGIKKSTPAETGPSEDPDDTSVMDIVQKLAASGPHRSPQLLSEEGDFVLQKIAMAASGNGDAARSRKMANDSATLEAKLSTHLDATKGSSTRGIVPEPPRLEARPNQQPQPHTSHPGAYAVGGIGGAPMRGEAEERTEAGTAEAQGEVEEDLGGLSRAFAVDEESINPDVEAVPFDTAAEAKRKRQGRRREQRGYLCGAVWMVCVAILVIITVIMLKNNGGGSSTTTTNTTQQPSSPPASLIPGVPSSAPTASLNIFLMSLPAYTLESLESSSTPQWKAMQWLSKHPFLLDMEDWRKTQLFALACFYFAMDGDNWREEIRTRWMDYNLDPCYWFNAKFGNFDQFSGNWIDNNGYNDTETCTKRGEIEILDLVDLGLMSGDGQPSPPHLPAEISLLSSLSEINFRESGINTSLSSFIPERFYQMSNLTGIDWSVNDLSGSLPSELGLLTGLTSLTVGYNLLTGSTPTQLGVLSNLTELTCAFNSISSTLPTQLGLLKKLDWLDFHENALTGPLPTQLGQLTQMTFLNAYSNQLTGTIPPSIGGLSDLITVKLDNNYLSGTIPDQLSSLQNLVDLRLNGNTLSGTIPVVFDNLILNGLVALSLSNNTLSGTVSAALCSMDLMDPASATVGLSFDCGPMLCGCCWCNCSASEEPKEVSDNTTGCSYAVYTPSVHHKKWPGHFPTPLNASNVVSINIHSDDFPEEISWEWSILDDHDSTWRRLEFGSPTGLSSLSAFTMIVESNSFYRLKILDSYGDGSCCYVGYGWFTVLDSTPSKDFLNGTVIWQAAGHEYSVGLDVILRVDWEGKVHHNSTVVADIPEPSDYDDEWPGLFPGPAGHSHAITLNIHTDQYPEDLTWEWSQELESGSWQALASGTPREVMGLFSKTLSVQSNSLYRLRLLDDNDDGLCCDYGFGWFTITNATPSLDHSDGTVIWYGRGDVLQSLLDVFIYVNSAGNAQFVT